MPEYIEREARYIDINKVTIPTGFFNQDLNVPKLLDWLNSQPTADVAEVVRCKDCKHSYFLSHCSKYECGRLPDTLFFSNDFCSYGERKTDD